MFNEFVGRLMGVVNDSGFMPFLRTTDGSTL